MGVSFLLHVYSMHAWRMAIKLRGGGGGGGGGFLIFRIQLYIIVVYIASKSAT